MAQAVTHNMTAQTAVAIDFCISSTLIRSGVVVSSESASEIEHFSEPGQSLLLLEIERVTNIAIDLERAVQAFQFFLIGGAAHVARNFRVSHCLLIEVREI